MAREGCSARTSRTIEILIVRQWLLAYTGLERRMLSRHSSRALPAIRSLEAAARREYRSQLARVPVGADGGTLRGSASSSRKVEVAIRKLHRSRMGPRGHLYRVGLAGMKETARDSSKLVAQHADGAGRLARALGRTDIAERMERAAPKASAASQLSGTTAWAFRRDLEQMADSAGHRAGLSSLSAVAGGQLSAAMGQASVATRLPRSSVTNSFLGTQRHAARSTVHGAARAAGTFGPWAAVAPYPSGRAAMLVRTETEWERLARRSARGAIRPGNPVSGFGMHVGSRTFFAPMLLGTDLALLASSMCLLLPDFLARSEANEDAARFEGIGDRALTFDGRGVESLGDLAREVEGELGALTAPVRRGRVGLGRFRDQPRITGRVLLVVPENTPARIPALLVVDRGAGAGVQDGLLWEIRGAGGSWKAHARVVAIYADTTTLAVVFDKGGKPKEVGDVATTFIQREELGVTA